MNHVVDEIWTGPAIQVPISTLDAVLLGRKPAFMKLDVEGWESEVLAGAKSTLSCSSLLCLIVEMNSSDAAFNANELAVHECLLEHGFSPYAYDPRTRSLSSLPSKNLATVNTIYLRDIDRVRSLVQSSPPFS